MREDGYVWNAFGGGGVQVLDSWVFVMILRNIVSEWEKGLVNQR